jgi:hypothetical protein
MQSKMYGEARIVDFIPLISNARYWAKAACPQVRALKL